MKWKRIRESPFPLSVLGTLFSPPQCREVFPRIPLHFDVARHLADLSRTG